MLKKKTQEIKTSKEVTDFVKKVKPGQSVNGMQILDYCRDDEGEVYVLVKLEDFVKHIISLQNKEA